MGTGSALKVESSKACNSRSEGEGVIRNKSENEVESDSEGGSRSMRESMSKRKRATMMLLMIMMMMLRTTTMTMTTTTTTTTTTMMMMTTTTTTTMAPGTAIPRSQGCILGCLHAAHPGAWVQIFQLVLLVSGPGIPAQTGTPHWPKTDLRTP